MTDDPFSLRKIALPAFGPSFLFGLGEGAILPVIALTVRQLGGSVALAALMVTLIGIGSLVSNIPASIITTRYGERWAIVGAAVWGALAMALCVLAPNLWAFGIGAFMVGMSAAVFGLARQSYLTEAVPFHFRARALSTLGGVMRIGLFLGPFLAAGLIHLMGIGGAYWAGVGALVLSAIVAVRMPDLPQHVAAVPSPLAAPTLPRCARRPACDRSARATPRSSSPSVSGPLVSRGARLAPSRDPVVGRTHRPGRRGDLADLRSGRRHRHAGLLSGRQGHGPEGPQLGRRTVDADHGRRDGLMPLTHGAVTLLLASLLIGFGNGIGSGMVDDARRRLLPVMGRAQFLGIWRLMSDPGATGGPVLLSAVTARSPSPPASGARR